MKTMQGVLVLTCLLLMPSVAWAHKPLMAVDDNGDGTIYIEAGFSDGSSGGGHKIVLKEKATDKIIKTYKMPAEGSMDVPKPDVPYTVTFDAGPGHAVTEDGPPPDAGAQETPDRPETPTAATTETAPSVVPQPAPAPVAAPPAQPVMAMSPGAQMAFRMAVTMQLVSAVVLSFIFGLLVFWVGYSMGKSTAGRKR